MQRVLITGANSFIGQWFRRLTPGFSVSECDLITTKVADIDFTDIDVVFHVAAIVHQDANIGDDIYYKINRDLAYDVARAAREAGVRHFVFMSTVKVYGENNDANDPWTELSICAPVDAYGKSKLEAELLLRELNADDFTVSIIRTPVVYGQGVKGNILRMARLVKKIRFIPLGGINNFRSMVYAGNLVALIKEVIIQQQAGIFLAADRKVISTSDFVQCLINATHKRIYLISIPRFAQEMIKKLRPLLYRRIFGSLVIDNTQTRKALNFIPPFSIQQGFDDLMSSL